MWPVPQYVWDSCIFPSLNSPFSFFLVGTDNESSEQNFSDLHTSFVKLSLGPHMHTRHTHIYLHSQTNAHSTKTHWRTIFWTDVVARSKGQKNVYRWRKSAWTWPGAYSLSKSVHTPLLLVQLAQNALQCMQDCARGILFNDRLIYIYFNYKRTLTVTVYCKRFQGA